ncbi:uncharacterized protein Ecym_3287 [Eremothecium cymbalariae DBVPG|uniref:Vacuolar membrane protein n=1 Tax=Eremothecium cymbalariae (strain CBS 270.75 / DBVPG 7215 / KCTC 17166 / NRRL Y-17582) TaxID=931890 RepID=G8JRL1_ERECY|nr:Hypothetical protein Ecym_3287 [Eremothecium cymbalariae DBVPG\
MVTPPSAANNPNIWKANTPPGTVFIVVGLAALAMLFAILTWYLVTEHISRRETKKSHYDSIEKDFEDEYANPFINVDRAQPGITQYTESNPKLPMDPPPSVPFFGFTAVNTPVDRFATIEEGKRLDGHRRSMFISPTIEVMNQRRRQNQNIYEVNQSLSSFDTQSTSRHDAITPGMSATSDIRRNYKYSRERYAANAAESSEKSPNSL